jgi:hypothetical protein
VEDPQALVAAARALLAAPAGLPKRGETPNESTA